MDDFNNRCAQAEILRDRIGDARSRDREKEKERDLISGAISIDFDRLQTRVVACLCCATISNVTFDGGILSSTLSYYNRIIA